MGSPRDFPGTDQGVGEVAPPHKAHERDVSVDVVLRAATRGGTTVIPCCQTEEALCPK
jgi:hypothetical protein